MKNLLKLTTKFSTILAIALFFSSCGKDTLTPATDINDIQALQMTETACVDINLHVYLEGGYDADKEAMSTDLHFRGLLPGQTLNGVGTPTRAGQPYATAPWNYDGKEGDNWTDANYTGNETDWILVSFRTDKAKSTEIAAAAALVNKDGSVTFVGDCVLESDIADEVYVVIEHRAHMGIMTDKIIDITDGNLTYDFRMQDSYTNGPASVGQKEVAPGVWAMYAGDVDQTDAISYDINGSDNIWYLYNGNFNIYLVADCNLDGDINGADKHMWMANNGYSSRVPK